MCYPGFIMCGIVAYVGKKKALPILIDGLKALEYRGYDSAGVAVHLEGAVYAVKCAGRIRVLEERLNPGAEAFSGIAHTRWATHGAPSDANAHPHTDCQGDIFIVHNGIIENHRELRRLLENRGHHFHSETDTETIAHLIESRMARKGKKLEAAVLEVLPYLKGTYALAIISRREPGKVVVARHFSPLLVGIGKDDYFAASDASAVLPLTKKVIYLNDGEAAVLTKAGVNVLNASTKRGVSRPAELLDWDIAQVQKGGWPHFMLKEIMETPQALKNAMAGRVMAAKGEVKLGGLEGIASHLKKINRLYIVACGSAYYAARYGEYLIENLAGLDVETDIASEFRYRDPALDPKRHALLVISQSGETADTLAALDLAKSKKLLTLGIVNVVGSTVARKTDAGIYQYAGPEIGVATTKAFSSQLAILATLGVWLGRLRKTLPAESAKAVIEELMDLPNKIELILNDREAIKTLAEKYKDFRDFFVLGRKFNEPIAFEGALKIKEITYRHAEGYPAGEMKHGPIAMVDRNFATIGIAPRDAVYEKMISNLQEIKARGGRILTIATEGDENIGKLSDDVIFIPKTIELLYPLLAAIPLQLFAYCMGTALGLDVDKPRNLAKSVTVE